LCRVVCKSLFVCFLKTIGSLKRILFSQILRNTLNKCYQWHQNRGHHFTQTCGGKVPCWGFVYDGVAQFHNGICSVTQRTILCKCQVHFNCRNFVTDSTLLLLPCFVTQLLVAHVSPNVGGTSPNK